MRPVLLYGAETWALTQQLENLLRSFDTRTLRYLTNTRQKDQVPNNEVERRCGLESLVMVLKRARLRWFSHVVRRDEGQKVKRAMNFEVEGSRPVGRPKKTWRKGVEEDMGELHINEKMAWDRNQ